MRILLCTNGAQYMARAMTLGAELALALEADVEILVAPAANAEESARRMVDDVVKTMEAAGLPVATHWEGDPFSPDMVEQHVQAHAYDLVVIGSRGRQGIVARLLGSVARRVTRCAPTSVLVVKGRARPLKHFLICTSAGPPSEYTIDFAGELARELGASVTLLHVMSQVPLGAHAQPEDLHATAEELIRRGSREGEHLSRMLDLLAGKGVAARAVVRHGLVLEAILDEARAEPCDLIVVGAHITPGLRSFLVADLAGDVVIGARHPVLVVRLEKQMAQRTSE